MKRLVLGMSVAILAAGCGGNATPSAAPKSAGASAAASAAKKRNTPEDQTAGMVAAVGLGKSTLPVVVKFELGSRPKAAEALAIDIAVVPQIAGQSLTVQVMPSDGLNIADVGPDLTLGAVDAGGVYRHHFSVTPGQAGVLLLDLNVSLKHDEMTESRVFAIPVFIADDPHSK
jgi:hypothetical protein